MLQQDSRDLAVVVRQKLFFGTLPRDEPTKMWVGKGSGSLCDVCDQPITSTEIEYEPDFSDRRVFRFHLNCIEVWHQQCL